MANNLLVIKQFGQRIWLDNLSRTLLEEHGLKRLIDDDGIVGVTANPSIFFKAMSESPYYRDDLARLKATSLNAEQRYEGLAVPDIQAACDLLRPAFDASGGDGGYVSLEVSPRLAYDEEGTVADAKRLAALVGRDNVLIKVPATPEGVRAFERLIGQGINVNVTLMFSLQHYEAIAQAYTRGARQWLKSGGDPRRLKSVASLFLSRVDTLVDKKLDGVDSEAALALRGKAAVAMAKLAYRRYREIFHGPAFADLAAAGVRPQHPLWASTGTKNPQYSDVMYIEPLIGPETVNTMPDATLAAFRDHGRVAVTLDQGVDDAEAHYRALEQAGIDLHAVGEQLQVEGVKLFDDAFTKLLGLMA